MHGSFLDKHLEKILLGAAVALLALHLVFGGQTQALPELQPLPNNVHYYDQAKAETVAAYQPGRYHEPTVTDGVYMESDANDTLWVAPEVAEAEEAVRVFEGISLQIPVPRVAAPAGPQPSPGPMLSHAGDLPPTPDASAASPLTGLSTTPRPHQSMERPLFAARDHDMVVLRSGKRIRGRIISERNASQVQILEDRGHQIVHTYPRKEVARELYQQNLVDACLDAIAAARKEKDYNRLLAISDQARRHRLHEEALKAAEAARSLNAARPDAYLAGADALIVREDLAGALRLLSSAPGQDDPQVALRRGEILVRQGKADDARKGLQQIVQHNPSLPEAHLGLAQALLADGDQEGASRHFQKALDLGGASLPALLGLGNVLLSTNDPVPAESYYLTATRTNSRSVDALVGLGVSRYLQSRFDDAKADCTQALLNSGMASGEAHLALGLIALALDDEEEARKSLADAVSEQPTLGRAHVALGYLEDRAGRTTEALTYYTRAAEVSPGDAFCHYTKGYAHWRLGQWALAEPAFEAATRLDSRSIDGWLALGAARLKQQKYGDAVTSCQEALNQFGSGHAALHSTLGLAYLGLGQHSDARMAFMHALETNRANVEALLGLGYLANQEKQEQEALRCFRDALSADGGNRYALEALQRLYADRGEQITYFGFDGRHVPRGLQITGQRYGLYPKVEQGHLELVGTMTANRGQNAEVFLESLSSLFLRLEVDVELPAATSNPMDTTEAGLYVQLSRAGEIRLGRNAAGKLFYQLRGRTPQAEQILGDWPRGATRLTIEQLDHKKGRFLLRVGLDMQREVTLPELALEGTLEAGAYVTTDRSSDAMLVLDNLMLTRRQPE